MLAGYGSGVPCLVKHGGIIPQALWNRFIRYTSLSLPEPAVYWNPISTLMNRLARCFPQPDVARWTESGGYRLFDRLSAWRLKRMKHKPQAVIAYECSSLETFSVAKQLGMKTILDAASVHHALQDEVCPPRGSESLHARIKQN